MCSILQKVKHLLFSLLFIFLHQNVVAKNVPVDSLIQALNTTSDTSKVNLLLDISFGYSTNDFKKSLSFAKEALVLSKELNHKKGICCAYNSMALAMQQNGKIDSAILYYDKTLNLSKKFSKPRKVALNGMGMAYFDKGEYETALLYYMQVLQLSEEDHDYLSISKSYNNIANLFYQQNQYSKALEYHFKSLKIGEELGNKSMIAGSYNNIGLIYGKLNQYEKALEYYFKTLKITEEIGHKLGMSYTLNNIGSIYSEENKLTAALEYFLKALELKYELDDKKGIANTLNNVANIYLELNQPLKAIEYLDKSIIISTEIGVPENLINAYQHKSNAYVKLNDYKNAYGCYTKYSLIKDSLFNADSQKNTAKVIAKYESDKKDQENALLAIEAKRQKTTISSLVIILIISLAFAWFAYYRFQEKKKITETLEKLSIVASKTDNYVSITDKNDIITWTNDGFTRITGYKYDEAKNKSLPSLLRGQETDVETVKKINEVKMSGKPFSEEILNYRKDGTPIWLSFNVSPVLTETGEVEKYITIGSDITEKKRAEHQLKFFAQTLEEKNKSISNSIRYAGKIQTAILPPDSLFQQCFKDHFVFYKPKDIVSGDFYWIEPKEEVVYFAVVDCTGHGVPGALMSMIGFNSLNKIVRENLIYSPATILDKLNDEVETILRQKDLKEIKDGMDIALCMYDKKTGELEYAGANHSLCLIRKLNAPTLSGDVLEKGENALYEIKGDRQPIGVFEDRKEFTNHKFKLLDGDCIYMFSDGYTDQFGGPKGKKYQQGQLKEFLLKISSRDMVEQKILLESTFHEWRGEIEQIDDICVMGVRI